MKDCSKPVVQLRTVAERTGIRLPAISHRLRSAGISSSEKQVFVTAGHMGCLPDELTWKTGGFEDKKIKSSATLSKKKLLCK